MGVYSLFKLLLNPLNIVIKTVQEKVMAFGGFVISHSIFPSHLTLFPTESSVNVL
jgi:hypothetical protein